MATSTTPQERGDVLPSGSTLQPGDCLRSPNGHYRLEFQASDGNLVLYRHRHDGKTDALWSSSTHLLRGDAHFATRLAMQADGNLVLYQANGAARWASNTHKAENSPGYAKLQNDGNFVLYRPNGQPYWATSTASQSHWMEALPGHLPLLDVCVPGSHDGGMYYTSINVGEGLALTQGQSVYEQLRRGSRYFDFRPNYVEHYIGTNDFYVHHGIADGHRVSVLLKDLARFFDEGSRETVIIEFSHWKNFADKGQDAPFIDLLLEHLPAHCRLTTPAANGVLKMPLDDLRGKLLVVIDNDAMYEHAVQGRAIKGIFSKSSSLKIYDDYANKHHYGAMLDDQQQKFVDFKNNDELFMLNWTLTPMSPDDFKKYHKEANPLDSITPGFIDSIVDNAASLTTANSVKTYAEQINYRLAGELLPAGKSPHALAQRNHFGKMVNIINLDFGELAHAVPVCEAITRLNLAVRQRP